MDIKVVVDTIWVIFAAALVFFMNLGFGAVEFLNYFCFLAYLTYIYTCINV